jgi:hypothetical protein
LFRDIALLNISKAWILGLKNHGQSGGGRAVILREFLALGRTIRI